MGTLLLGANLPDVDVTSYLWGAETALWFRRGLTHGILGVAVWPFVLTGVVLLWDRWIRRRLRPDAEPAAARPLLLLSAVAVLSHPLLDLLNVYGIRLLAPFSQHWFYGDALFIIDPWLWLILGLGCWLARWDRRRAVVSLLAAAVYVATLAVSGAAARARIAESVRAEGGEPVRVMAAPVAVTPFTRWAVVEQGGGYWVGLFDWLSEPRVTLTRLPYESGGVVLREAAEAPLAGRFLSWARFPFYTFHGEGESLRVLIGDARYTIDPAESWASTSVHLKEIPEETVPPPR